MKFQAAKFLNGNDTAKKPIQGKKENEEVKS